LKRLIAAAILTVTVIGIYLGGYFVINDVCDNANIMLKNCINAYNKGENAEKKAEELEKYWSKKEKILSVFSNHSEIDEIEMAIRLMKLYSKTKENEIFNEYCGTVKVMLHQMIEDTVPNMHSIF